ASPAKSARRFGGVKLALPLNFAEAIEAATRAAKLTDTISQSQSLADVAAFSVDGRRFGVVDRVIHRDSGCLFARKRIRLSFDQQEHELQQREISVLKRTVECPFVVYFYGAMFHDGDIHILMELMDASLRQFYLAAYSSAVNMPITNPVLQYIAYSVLKALKDIKPSNMLINRSGQVKLCDFGVAGILKNSIAKSNVGCQLYVAPERVSISMATEGGLGAGDEPGFTTASDVWSLGISLLELASGAHPYGSWKNPFHQVQHLTEDPPPSLSAEAAAGRFPQELNDFLSCCLAKEAKDRWRLPQLLEHPYVGGVVAMETELRDRTGQFVCSVLDRCDSSSLAAVGVTVKE
uniref:mitogen-activated protein kinase kinase n=1 Tax=Macrostomum lignano TaxID=282301 RepID=A0A1I8FJP5_9PLAT